MNAHSVNRPLIARIRPAGNGLRLRDGVFTLPGHTQDDKTLADAVRNSEGQLGHADRDVHWLRRSNPKRLLAQGPHRARAKVLRELPGGAHVRSFAGRCRCPGALLACESLVSGCMEDYAVPVPASGPRVQISVGGGQDPR